MVPLCWCTHQQLLRVWRVHVLLDYCCYTGDIFWYKWTVKRWLYAAARDFFLMRRLICARRCCKLMCHPFVTLFCYHYICVPLQTKVVDFDVVFIIVNHCRRTSRCMQWMLVILGAFIENTSLIHHRCWVFDVWTYLQGGQKSKPLAKLSLLC